MNIWRLERLRLFRTGRFIPVAAVFAAFGVLGPVTVRYAASILERVSSGQFQITIPPSVPADGVRSFLGNANQLGLLTAVIIAAGALTFDAKPALSAFLRTRVTSVRDLVLPKYAWNAALAIAAWVAGSAIAWTLTTILLGHLSPRAMLEGIGFGALYFAFAIAVVALAASLGRTQLSAILIALGLLLAMPIMGLVKGVEPWMPSQLAGSLDALLRGATAGDYLRSALVALVAGPVALWLAISRGRAREV